MERPTPDTMTAVVQDQYGTVAADVLGVEQIARPSIGDDEVLVRTRAAGVDRGTWHLMAGLPLVGRIAFGLRSPKIRVPGRDVAGTVEAVGKNVSGFTQGDEVYGSCGATHSGSFAELSVARANRLAIKPANLTFEEAAAVPISGFTALQAVRKAHVEAGQTVAVLGASGGVGTYAVQIAKAFGADVTGVCSAAKADLVRALGADHVIDYGSQDVTDGEPYDVIIDLGGNRTLSQLRGALTPEGRLVIAGGETDGRWFGGYDRQLRAEALSPFVSQTLGQLTSSENAEDLVVLRDLIEAGQITPAVDRTYPLAEAAAAVQHLVDGRARGKVVITV